MKKRGSIKVMVNSKGIPRIQEDLGDSIKIYSHEEWQAEQKRRAEEDAVTVTNDDVSVDEKEERSLIQDDVEDSEKSVKEDTDEETIVAKPKKTRKKKA